MENTMLSIGTPIKSEKCIIKFCGQMARDYKIRFEPNAVEDLIEGWKSDKENKKHLVMMRETGTDGTHAWYSSFLSDDEVLGTIDTKEVLPSELFIDPKL